MDESIFRKASLDRVSSPEQLNDYIKVSNPSIWVVLCAMILLLAGLFAWGIWGSVPTTLSVTGIARDGIVSCYVPSEDAGDIRVGQTARVGQIEGQVCEVSEAPLSYEEAAAAYTSDYTIHTLRLSDWNTVVRVEAPVPDGLQQLTLVTDAVRPVFFLLNTR